MNLSVIKIDDKLDMFKDDFEVESNCNFYLLRLDEKTIGRSKIFTAEQTNNRLEIFILSEYRGNGYGKYLFGEMLKEIKKDGYKEINVQINRENIIARKIIEDFGGLKIAQNKEITTFVVPIK